MAGTRGSARGRLLEAADRLFYAEGIHTVGIDRLIAEAGVAKGSLFYNFSGKDELVGAYLSRRQDDRRDRIERHQVGRVDPVDRLLAIFDALAESVSAPTFNGCPFMNAAAEAAAGSVEADAVQRFRQWLGSTIRDLTAAVGVRDVDDVARQIRVLYDGATAMAQLDHDPDAVRLAGDMARGLLEDARTGPATPRVAVD